jgi:hypothetical protein
MMNSQPPITDQPLPQATETPDILTQVQRMRERLAQARLDRQTRLAHAQQPATEAVPSTLEDPFG